MTTTPAKDLTDENLAKYDVLLLNYKDTPKASAETQWSDANKAAFLKAVKDGGKGLVVHHFASAAFANPNWKEFEQAIAGGWRTQGYHGPEARVHREEDRRSSTRSPRACPPSSTTSSTSSTRPRCAPGAASCWPPPTATRPSPRAPGMDEAVIWVNQYGKGRVFNNALGPRHHGDGRQELPGVDAAGRRVGGHRPGGSSSK